MTDITITPIKEYEEIDWDFLDINAVYAFYNSINRPVEQRVLLCAPINPALHHEWRRQCVADYKAMQGRACPGCAA
jgi:hypothetical protein